MKNPFILLSALLMVAFLLPACSPAPEVDCTSAELFCVGMLTDSGKINDLSMNQAAWEAVQRAEQDLGARIQYVESSDASEHAQTIAALGDEGYDIIVTVGPALG